MKQRNLNLNNKNTLENIRRNPNKVDWNHISRFQELSEDFKNEFYYKLNATSV